MKAVILAGGMGSRLGHEAALLPKPMIELAGFPLLWHIMKLYTAHGIVDFVICCGSKGYMIKEYFANYALHLSDVTIDLGGGRTNVHRSNVEPWRVTLVDTGVETKTGGRLKRVASYLGGEEFCFTYGDSVSDVNITELVAFHRAERKLATVTAVVPPGRRGQLQLDGAKATPSPDAAKLSGTWLNGGYSVLSPKVIDYIEGDATDWEREPMERLSAEGNLNAFVHRGFWHQLETSRDQVKLEDLWQRGAAPWKIW